MPKAEFDVNSFTETEILEIACMLQRREMNPFAAGGNPTGFSAEQEEEIKARAEQIFPDRFIAWHTLPFN